MISMTFNSTRFCLVLMLLSQIAVVIPLNIIRGDDSQSGYVIGYMSGWQHVSAINIDERQAYIKGHSDPWRVGFNDGNREAENHRHNIDWAIRRVHTAIDGRIR